MTNKAATLAKLRAEAVNRLVDIFDASGAEYTSAAAVHAVIRNDARREADTLCQQGFRVNPWPLMRATVDAIHARRFGR